MRITTALLVLLAVCLSGCKNTGRQSEKGHQQAPEEPEGVYCSLTYPNRVVSLTDSEFRRCIMDYEAHPQEWVYEGRRPAVVDFYATWCRPCKMMSPIVEDMAQRYSGKVDFYKVDIDSEQELAAAFGIQSVPTFLFIPLDGNPIVRIGAMQKEDFDKAIGEVLAK